MIQRSAERQMGVQHGWEMGGRREQVRQCRGRKGKDLDTDSVTGLDIFHEHVSGALTSGHSVLVLD